jgi:hypothetical protein
MTRDAMVSMQQAVGDRTSDSAVVSGPSPTITESN